MNKLVASLILVILLFVTGCVIDGRPPDYSITNPSTMIDKSGNMVVAYQVNFGHNSRSTYIRRLGEQGNFLWGEKSLELYSDRQGFLGNGDIDCASMISDEKGNVFVVYPIADGIRVQKLNMEGKDVLSPIILSTDNTAVVPSVKAVSDNSGGVIIAWIEGMNNINMQHLGNGGNILWQKTMSTPEIDQFNMVCDSSGNTFVLWKDKPGYSEANIFLGKVNSSGIVPWVADSLLLSDVNGPADTKGTFVSQIISDGNGGAIAVWVQPVLNNNGQITSQKLFTQRVRADGEILWNSGIMPSGANSEQATLSEPRIIWNGLECVVFWTSDRSIRAQCLDGNGNRLWTEGGITQDAGSTDAVYYYPSNGNNPGEVAFVWNSTEEGKIVLRAQCLDVSGNKKWGDKGIKVSSAPAYWAAYAAPARISPAVNGSFIVTWASGENIKAKTLAYIQRISADGTLLWGEKGIKLQD
jgi:hypothetical protein